MTSNSKLKPTAKRKITFTPQSNIPIPRIRTNQAKYPWDKMWVGASFFVPGASPSGMSATMKYAAKKRGWKFTRRTVVENGVKGVRVWRIE